MKVGFVLSDKPGEVDRILADVAKRLINKGYQVSGTVQVNRERTPSSRCDMDVHILPRGPAICISQDLGEGAVGCRLDPEALEIAVERVSRTLPGADFLIVNKFGRHEAEGRGFRSLIGEAVARGLPVVVGVNEVNLVAFQQFTAGIGELLATDATALIEWATGAVAGKEAQKGCEETTCEHVPM